jgi:hypothetical protein
MSKRARHRLIASSALSCLASPNMAHTYLWSGYIRFLSHIDSVLYCFDKKTHALDTLQRSIPKFHMNLT